MITLMRHFDSENIFENDLERPLSKIGINKAHIFKKNRHLSIDFAFVSPAQRAIDTFYNAIDSCPFEIEPLLYDLEFKDEHYLRVHYKKTSNEALLELVDRLQEQLNQYKQSIVIGHDRLLQKLAYHLTKNKEAQLMNLRFGDCIQIDYLKNLKLLSASNELF